jgi:hypothetical protein
MTYRSKRDLGVALVAVPVRLAMVAAGIVLLSLVVLRMAPLLALLPGVLLTVLGGLMLWAFFSTSCEITPRDLFVRFGPLRWRIPLDAITAVVRKGGLYPDRAWGLAWSLDRLVIEYRRRNGRQAFLGVAVSPEDREGFLRDLAQATQRLHPLKDEG